LKTIHAILDLIRKCADNQCKRFRASVELSADFHLSENRVSKYSYWAVETLRNLQSTSRGLDPEVKI
jgi:hypothetical protein